MVAQAGQPPAELDQDTLTPLCDEAEFAREVNELVADEAPRLFAVVHEYGERVDGCVAAWGLAFEDHVEVIGVGGRRRHVITRSPERAARAFRRPHITTRLVWVTPAAHPQPAGDETA